MQGMFRANGGCGYVKKPDFLMNVGPNGEVFDPNENSHPKKTLKVGYLYRWFHSPMPPKKTCLTSKNGR